MNRVVATASPARRRLMVILGCMCVALGVVGIVMLGYFIGRFIENRFGGEPWPVTSGVLVGLVAGFRQVFLMLSDRSSPRGPRD